MEERQKSDNGLARLKSTAVESLAAVQYNCMAIELGRTTKIYINIWHYNGKRQYITGLAKYTCVCCIAWELLWLSHLVDGQNQTDG